MGQCAATGVQRAHVWPRTTPRRAAPCRRSHPVPRLKADAHPAAVAGRQRKDGALRRHALAGRAQVAATLLAAAAACPTAQAVPPLLPSTLHHAARPGRPPSSRRPLPHVTPAGYHLQRDARGVPPGGVAQHAALCMPRQARGQQRGGQRGGGRGHMRVYEAACGACSCATRGVGCPEYGAAAQAVAARGSVRRPARMRCGPAPPALQPRPPPQRLKRPAPTSSAPATAPI